MSEPLTNCHTCGWDAGVACYVPRGREAVGEWLEQHDAMADASGRPISTATGCPGWKPKPAAIPEHDRPGHRPNVDRAQVAALGWEAPKQATVKESLTVAPERDPLCDGTSADLVMVKRAEWDDLLARIDALESRVGEVERRGRTDSARLQATMRRDKLRRGGR